MKFDSLQHLSTPATLPHRLMGDTPSAQVASMMAHGLWHQLQLRRDGTLWASGDNRYGQLGDGSRQDQRRPVLVGRNFCAMAAGRFLSLVLTRDASLWAWGYIGDGPWGDGSGVDQARPVQIARGCMAIAAGALHSLLLKHDGTLWAWGHNGQGQLGHTVDTKQTLPTPMGHGYREIATTDYQSMALHHSGQLIRWGVTPGEESEDNSLGTTRVQYDDISLGDETCFLQAAQLMAQVAPAYQLPR